MHYYICVSMYVHACMYMCLCGTCWCLCVCMGVCVCVAEDSFQRRPLYFHHVLLGIELGSLDLAENTFTY